MSRYPVPTVGARGCALSHSILQPTRHQDPSKSSTSPCIGCPGGHPSSKEAPRCTTNQVFQLAQTSQNQRSPSLCPSTRAKRPSFDFTHQMLCAAWRLQNTKPPLRWANPFQQVQLGGRSSTPVHWCKLATAPAEPRARTSPLQELVCILGRMLKNISDPQTFTFWSEVSNVAVVY